MLEIQTGKIDQNYCLGPELVVLADRTDTTYFDGQTMDMLAEAIGVALMQAIDESGKRLPKRINPSSLPGAASAALNAVLGRGRWATRQPWPKQEQLEPMRVPEELRDLLAL